MRADDLASFLPVLFDKHDVTPRGRAELTGVVVGIARPNESILRHMIPFFARDFAGFATNAHSRIREETNLDVVAHVRVPALICAVCAFADHENQIRKAGKQENRAQETGLIRAKKSRQPCRALKA